MSISIGQNGHLYIENAEIMRGSFRNFSGEKTGRYDQPGKRYFHVVIEDPEIADELTNDGWAVHILAPRDPQDDPVHFLKISVKPNSTYFRCDCYSVANGNTTLLNEQTLKTLDGADIQFADLDIRPYEYEAGNISAQLEEGYFNIASSRFASKYGQSPKTDDDYVPW